MKHIKLFDGFSSVYKKNMLDEGSGSNWTPEKIRQAIKDGGYVNRSDLAKKNPNLYKILQRRNMLGEFFDEQGNKK